MTSIRPFGLITCRSIVAHESPSGQKARDVVKKQHPMELRVAFGNRSREDFSWFRKLTVEIDASGALASKKKGCDFNAAFSLGKSSRHSFSCWTALFCEPCCHATGSTLAASNTSKSSTIGEREFAVG